MTEILKEKTRPQSWYNETFLNQFSFDSLTHITYDKNSEKIEHNRTRSLSSRFDNEIEKSDYNLNSTNQTSVEVSIEDSNPHQTDYKLSGVLKVPEESFLNFSFNSQSKKNDTGSSKRFRNDKRKNSEGSKNDKKKPNFYKVEIGLDKKLRMQQTKLANKKKVLSQNFLKDGKTANLNDLQRKASDAWSEENKNEKLKIFTPILASKAGKHSKDAKIEENSKENKKSIIKKEKPKEKPKTPINESLTSKILSKDNKNPIQTTEKLEAQTIKEKNSYIVLTDSSKSDEDFDTIDENLLFFPLKLSFEPNNIEAYSSPLKNVHKFLTQKKMIENPYENFQVTPNLAQTLEELQKNLILSDTSDQDSVRSSQSSENQILEYKNVEKPIRFQGREPSFGPGGGDFICFEEKSETHPNFYTGNLAEVEKNTQTDLKSEGLDEILAMITDKDFMNSLKIIGKFANFLEKKF